MRNIYKLTVLWMFFIHVPTPVSAQSGYPYIHDPSTLAGCDGKWYTFGTGGGGLVTADGWHWYSGPVRPGGGAAPDVMKIGDRYLFAYSSTGGGFGGGHKGQVLTMWNATLDPDSPLFRYTDPVEVAFSDSDEDCDAIDAGLVMDNDGRLWLTYGTYFGNIRIVELDPGTGLRREGSRPKDIAIDCEATDIIYRDGWYYLLGTHGTCCDGLNSTYNIVCGRSRNVEGPYLDNVGRDMIHGGGKMVIGGERRAVGAGHFGRTVIDEEVEVMSFHWEADLDRSGHSVLAIRPLLWDNGWPCAGEPFREGTYEIQSCRHGYALELAVDFVRMEGDRRPWFLIDPEEPVEHIANQTLDDVSGGWPEGVIPVRLGDYMSRPHQRWTITAVPESGGYLSAPYFKISIAGSERCLTAAGGCAVGTSPSFTGDDVQLWRIEQLTDGSFRIMPKSLPGGSAAGLCLYSIGDSTLVLAPYDFSSDNSKWSLKLEFAQNACFFR